MDFCQIQDPIVRLATINIRMSNSVQFAPFTCVQTVGSITKSKMCLRLIGKLQ